MQLNFQTSTKMLEERTESASGEKSPGRLAHRSFRSPEPLKWLSDVSFRINGQIGELGQKDKLSYTNLMHQIDSGKRKGHSDFEMVEAVVKAATPGLSLRDMLEAKSNLTLVHLKTILKAHFKRK